MKNMNNLGGGNNIDNLHVDNNENKNLEQNKEQDKKGLEFSKEDIGNGKKRQAIVNFLNAELSAQMKQEVGLGFADEGWAKKQIFDVQDRLKNASNNYNTDHNDDAFLYVVNDIMDKINQGAEVVNGDETKTKKLENTARIKESIIVRNKKGEISDSLMNHKLNSLEKVNENINKDFDMRRFGFLAEKRMKEDDEKYAESVKRFDQKDYEFRKKCTEYEAMNGGKLTAEQRAELKKLRGEANTLWDERTSLEEVVSVDEEERKAKLVAEIAAEEQRKAEERRKQLESVLGSKNENQDNSANVNSVDDKVDATPDADKKDDGDFEGVTAAQFRQFMRTGVAGHHNRPAVSPEKSEAEVDPEKKKREEINKFYASLLPKPNTIEAAGFHDGVFIGDAILDTNSESMSRVQQIIDSREDYLKNTNKEELSNEKVDFLMGSNLGSNLLLNYCRIKDDIEISTESEKKALYTKMFNELFSAKNKLLSFYDPRKAAAELCKATGKVFNSDDYKDAMPEINKGQYEAALNLLNGFQVNLIYLMGQEIGSNDPSTVIDAFQNEKKTESYRKLSEEIALIRESNQNEKMRVSSEDEVSSADKNKLQGENESNLFNLSERDRIYYEKKAVSADFVRSFFNRDADFKVKTYLNGLNYYQDGISKAKLTTEMLKTQAENSAEIAKNLKELKLETMFKKFAKDMTGDEESRKFGASYLYNELKKQWRDVKSYTESSAFRSLSKSERQDLYVKRDLLFNISDSLNDFCSEAFGKEKYDVRYDLANYSKSNKLNIVKTLVRNLSFMRKR